MALRLGVLLGLAVICAHSSRAQTLKASATRDVFLVAPSSTLLPSALSVTRPTFSAQAAAWFDHWAGMLHSNFGVSAAAPAPALGPAGALGATLIYLAPTCDGCDSWLGARLEAQRALTHRASAQLSFGRAFRLNTRGSSTSAALWLPVNFRGQTMSIALTPGVVMGGFATGLERSRAIRPAIAAAAERHFRGFSVRLGAAAVVPTGAPVIVGIEPAWPR